jgi:hypothetical protein
MKEGTPIAMVRIVLDLFKGKELAIDAACGLFNRDAKTFACAAIAAFGFAAGTPNAREVSKQPGLREILAALAAGRNVSARVSLPL